MPGRLPFLILIKAGEIQGIFKQVLNRQGKADYGYGNIYSVLYYTALHNYKNVVIVPIEKETRKYSIGVIGGIGIAMVNEKEAYESVFKKADAALYKAKGYNKPHVIIYDEAKNGL